MQSLGNVSRLLLAALALLLPGARVLAAEPAEGERRCPGLIAGLPDVRLVKFAPVTLSEGEVRLTYPARWATPRARAAFRSVARRALEES